MQPTPLLKSLCFLLLLLAAPLLSHSSFAQASQIDSLENLLAHVPGDTNRVAILTKLSAQYRKLDNVPQALKNAEMALQLAQQLNFNFGIAQALNALGSYYYSSNQNQEAFQHYQKAVAYYQKADRKIGLAIGYGNLAMVSEDIGMYAKAMEYYLKSNKLAEAVSDEELIGKNLSHMGILMLNQKNYEQALHYLFQALSVQETLPVNKGYTLNTTGVVYQEMKQYDKALAYLHRSLSIFDSLNHTRGQVNCYNNLGIVHFFLQQYDTAITFFRHALEKSEPNGYTQSFIVATLGIGDIYLQTGKARLAIGLYEKALHLATSHQMVLNEVEAYEGLSKAYDQLGDYQQAYRYQSELLSRKDSVFNSENTRKVAQLEAGYELEKKQAEIQLLEKDKEQQLFMRNTIAAGLFGVVLIAVLVISQLRLKINKNRLLVEKSEEIASKNRQLENQSQQLTISNNQLARQSEQLAAQTEKLKKLDEAKSRFFANISHEFRTPLTLILNNLLDRISHVKQQHIGVHASELPQLQVMYRNAQRLLRLINQLLDLSKLESGNMNLTMEEGDLSELINVVYASFSSLATFRGIRFDLSLPPSPLMCRFDADKVEKILYNLLSNAFKFTPNEGEIILTVTVENGPENKILQIVVKDNGEGIAPEQMERVFDRFYQGDQYAADEQGTGIGLALTKELVELHGGKIWADNNPGKGARFTVQMPFIPTVANNLTRRFSIESIETPEDHPGALTSSSEMHAVQQNERPTILLVEDNKDLRNYIRMQLAEKYYVLESENGLQGLIKAGETIPDLIISDWMMPELSGIELCERLKSDERTSHIPIILLTALATEDGKLKGLETGADDYLAKPFDNRELAIRVHNLIESRRKLRERFSRELYLEPANISVTSTDEKFLQKVLKIIEEHMSDCEFNTEEFSSEIGMSRMQLHRKLKALTGQGPGDFLRVMRLKRAAYLLEQQAGNVSEVAYQVGFNHLSHFTKSFREQFGMNPSDFIARKPVDLSK